jgi:hypothetical protein
MSSISDPKSVGFVVRPGPPGNSGSPVSGQRPAGMPNEVFATPAALNAEAPDHRHDSTVDNLGAIYGVSEKLACWRKERVAFTAINEYMLHAHDPEEVEAEAKIESIRETIREGRALPAVVLIHKPDEAPRSYHVLEGLHRYNAAHREQVDRLHAWVAHIGCCGGLSPDL